MKSLSKLCLLSITLSSLAVAGCRKNKDDDRGEQKASLWSTWEEFEGFIGTECTKHSEENMKDAQMSAELIKSMCSCAAKEERGILQARYGEVGNLPNEISLTEEEGNQIGSKCSAQLSQTPQAPAEQPATPVVVAEQPATPPAVVPPTESNDITIDASEMHFPIPDESSEGILLPLELDVAGVVGDIGFSIGLTHDFLGDVVVSLTSPDGSKVVLFDQAANNLTALSATYGLGGEAHEGLAALKGKAIAGTWTISVSDRGANNFGFLESFKLVILPQ